MLEGTFDGAIDGQCDRIIGCRIGLGLAGSVGRLSKGGRRDRQRDEEADGGPHREGTVSG